MKQNIKQIWSIAKVEISQLFYSPVAWLIIVLFTWQVDSSFSSTISRLVSDQDLRGGLSDVTFSIFANFGGLWRQIQGNLYLFIPLLTMGLMSRDLSSGSIKLLYSSPVTSSQIIVGKFLSVMIFSLIMIACIVPDVIFTYAVVENMDVWLLVSGITGLILLMWAYAAIGLFMSSLTGYQVVAALLTLGGLTLLNSLGRIGQNIEFVRDLTYWASISGRAENFIVGLISSEDIIYFVLVIILFVSFSIFLLQYRKTGNRAQCVAKYAGSIIAVLLIGYATSRPALTLYADLSQTKANTLTDSSREIVEAFDGPVTVTTYVNLADYDSWMGAPSVVNDDIKRYQQYFRFKPDILMNYVYYYDEPYTNIDYGADGTAGIREMAMKFADSFEIPVRKILTPEQIRQRIDLLPERNEIVKVLEGPDGNRTFLRIFEDMTRYPEEQEITTALYRLQQPAVQTGFLAGHGERSITRGGDGDWSGFTTAKGDRFSLVNTGYDVRAVDLSAGDTLDGLDLLVIADLRRPLEDDEYSEIMNFIDRGGNLLLAVEPQWTENAMRLLLDLGVYALPGNVVYMDSDYSPALVPALVAPYGRELSHLLVPGLTVSMPGCLSLDYSLSSDWNAIPLLVTPEETWNETVTTDFDAVQDKSAIVPEREAGEFVKVHTLALALTREIGGRQQRIAVLGDADCLGNMEMGIDRKSMPSVNAFFRRGLFNWLSDGRSPIDVRRPSPIDNSIALTIEQASVWAVLLKWLVPLLLSLTGAAIVLRRLRR